jgi:hypothetical protein
MREVAGAAVAVAPDGALSVDPSEAVETVVSRFVDPWMRFFLRYDPSPALRELRVPVLALLGSLDVQASAAVNAPAIESALAENPNSTVIALDNLNHLFQTARTGAISEYESLNEPFADEVIDLIARWINDKV